MTHTSTEQPEPRYADVVHHANVSPSLAYVARKTGLGYQETTRLLELALKRGDLAGGDYSGRRLDRYVEDREAALTKEVEQLRARVQELEAAQANLTSALEDIASGEITRSHCVGPHCTEETGVATADEMASRAAGALHWHGITQEKQG